ncbi:MAG: DUF4198 domain-containing protein [Acidobacteria bacterium]|nr:MAG: DUF4198 domain-containing protein [Acidobacteriota bacterium]
MLSRLRFARLAPAASIALASIAGAVPSPAHDMWILPATFAPAAGELVAVSLRVGHPGGEERVVRDGGRIVRFAALGPETLPIPGLEGQDPAGYLRPPVAGLYALVYESRPAYSELPGPRFTAYLEEEGLDAVVAWRAARGETLAAGRELYSRSLKSLIVAGDGATARDRPVGLPLELVVESDLGPRRGPRPVTLRLLYRGRPLAGALVDLRPLAGDGSASSVRSGADGRLTVELAPGAWMAAAVAMERAAGGEAERAEWRSIFATLTFELSRDDG